MCVCVFVCMCVYALLAKHLAKHKNEDKKIYKLCINFAIFPFNFSGFFADSSDLTYFLL